MGKYVIALCIGILIGNALRRVFEKHWMDILIGIIYVVMFVIITPLYIITLPIRIFNAISYACVTESKIIREYDRIFYEASSMEKVAKINRKIVRFQKTLEQRLNKRREKENQKEGKCH